MPAQLLDGKTLSAKIKEKIARRVLALKEKGVVPGLAVILVGEDPASQIYVRNKERGCAETGIHSITIRLPASISQHDLEKTVDELNAARDIHGILVQLPLPSGLNEAAALTRILPEKDVDGFHMLNAGRLFSGLPSVAPCTPRGAMEMLHAADISAEGKEAVVVGRSNIVGKPMAMLLLRENATVTLCHSRTQNLASHTRRADILVAAVGRPGLIGADMVKPGAAVIDVGINRIDGKVIGDVDFEAVRQVAGWITPVPGGVGRMTIAMLLLNTLEAAERTVP